MLQGPDTCAICLDTLVSSSDFRNASAEHNLTLHCVHSYHRACIARFLAAGHAYDHDHRQLSCPKCKADEQLAVFAPSAASSTSEAAAAAALEEENLGYITNRDISLLVQSGHLSKHQQSSISRQLAEAVNVAEASALAADHCIKCNAHLGLQPDTHNNGQMPSAATCRHCQTKQCGSCGVEWLDAHAGVSCSLFKARQQHAAADPASRKLLECSLPCPGCGHGIIKVAGCNKVRCAKCKTLICWNCGERLPPGRAAYEHFGKAGQGICRKYAAARPSWVAEGVDYRPERQRRPQKQQQTGDKEILNKEQQKQESQQHQTDSRMTFRKKRRRTAADSDDEWTPKLRKRA